MRLRNKFLSPKCAHGLGDVDTYFFFEKIFRSEIRMCVKVTSFFFEKYVTITHSDLRSKYFFQKKGTSLDAVISGTMKTVFFAFGIIYLFWPSDDAYFYYINRSAILFYSNCVLEAS